MRNKMMACCLLMTIAVMASAQTVVPVYFKGAVENEKSALHRGIIQNTITKNLSLPLSADTEDQWMDAFWGLALIRYQSPWANGRVSLAVDAVATTGIAFQRALIELLYTNYPQRFVEPVRALAVTTSNAKVFAMCCEYLLRNKVDLSTSIHLAARRKQLVNNEKDDAILTQLYYRLTPISPTPAPLAAILHPTFLKGHTVIYSMQRKNRDFPGLAIIRDTAGNFSRDIAGNVFAVPQLARSISNLPGYLTNGNTPQGIFRMYGVDTSKNSFIGPTPNLQLTMPFETSLQHFFGDSTITDTSWTNTWYQQLLPATLKNYRPLFESFYAGKAGRTEIIAHGTTIDPAFYTGTSYYPQTPTMGCLCTSESWSGVDGQRLESDQQQLVDAVLAAGGARGYLVVIEVDDQQLPVTINEILPLLQRNAK